MRVLKEFDWSKGGAGSLSLEMGSDRLGFPSLVDGDAGWPIS